MIIEIKFTCAHFFWLKFFLVCRIYIKILSQEYKVFYIGTNNGRIYKIVQFMQNGDSKSTLLDIFEVAPNEPIQVMQISQKRKSLYVSTDHRIKQIDLAMCSRRYDSCFRCVKDPYCGWDGDSNSCKPYELGLLQVRLYIRIHITCLRIWQFNHSLVTRARWFSLSRERA